MAEATSIAPPAAPGGSIDSDEAAHFGRLAADWWNPDGTSAMLHRINPVRMRYVRERIDAHWSLDARERQPMAGTTALDMGCGAGLACEPLARLGARVTGVDAANETVAAARVHAVGAGLDIDYRQGDAAAVAGQQFDLITCFEVIEHVTDPTVFVADLARLLAPGGLLIMSTPNRTWLSRLSIITAGEGLGLIPRGTHDWDKFLTPDELGAALAAAGLRVVDTTGFAYDPVRGARVTESLALDYLVTAIRG